MPTRGVGASRRERSEVHPLCASRASSADATSSPIGIVICCVPLVVITALSRSYDVPMPHEEAELESFLRTTLALRCPEMRGCSRGARERGACPRNCRCTRMALMEPFVVSMVNSAHLTVQPTLREHGYGDFQKISHVRKVLSVAWTDSSKAGPVIKPPSR